jgi:hypothetical protein
MNIRWGRGLYRAWVVFAVVWVSATGWMTFGPDPTPLPDKSLINQYNIPSIQMSDSEIFFREAKRGSWVFLPPALLLLIGLGGGWAIRGFKD